MGHFSSTRAADKQTAITGNAQLQAAITWLRSNTDLGRMNELEVFEIIQAATANNNFKIVFSAAGSAAVTVTGGTAIP